MASLPARLGSALSLCALVLAASCGGGTADDGTPPPTDSGADSTKPTDSGDSSVPPDTAADTATPTEGGDDTSSGDTSAGDTSPGDVGISCGPKTCFGGDVCCATPTDAGADFVCAKSCPDGGVTIACDSAASCGGAGNHCCAKVESTPGGVPPTCFKTGSASCAKSCPTSLPLTGCGSPGQVRLCKTKAECDEPGNGNCCTFSAGSFTGSFCVPDLVKGYALGCL